MLCTLPRCSHCGQPVTELPYLRREDIILCPECIEAHLVHWREA